MIVVTDLGEEHKKTPFLREQKGSANCGTTRIKSIEKKGFFYRRPELANRWFKPLTHLSVVKTKIYIQRYVILAFIAITN